MDGLDVCRALRKESEVPIHAHGSGGEIDRLIGLELGADDYVTKPFSPRELVARVKVILRRVHGGVRNNGLIRAGDLEIDLNGHRVCATARSLGLTDGVQPVDHPGPASRPDLHPGRNWWNATTVITPNAAPMASVRRRPNVWRICSGVAEVATS